MNVSLKEMFYFMGLTQSDGGLYVFVRGDTPVLKPVYKLASLTNTNTLELSTDFLKRIGVYSGYSTGVGP